MREQLDEQGDTSEADDERALDMRNLAPSQRRILKANQDLKQFNGTALRAS